MNLRSCGILSLILLAAFSERSSADDIKAASVRGAVNQDGRFEVFAIASNGNLYHRWQMAGPVDWTNWKLNAPGQFSDVSVVRSIDGRLFAFGIDNGQLTIRSQAIANGGWPAGSVKMGHDLRKLAVGQNADGRLEAFALGADGALYSTNAVDIRASNWSPWRFLAGANLRELAVERDGGGRLTVVAIGASGAASVIQQTVKNGAWGTWLPLEGHDLVEVKLARSINGTLTLLAVGADGRLYSRALSSAGGSWSAWTLVSAQALIHLSSLSVATNANGLVELAAVSAGTSVVHMSQRGDGTWPGVWTVFFHPSAASGAETVSIVAGNRGQARIFMNDRHRVCTIERTSNTQMDAWAGADWRCFGTASQMVVERSGMYSDSAGRRVLVTQGLSDYTLVSAKSILFRVFTDNVTLAKTKSVGVSITLFGSPTAYGGGLSGLQVSWSDLIFERSPPLGPSIGFMVPGRYFRAASTARVELKLQDTNDHLLQQVTIDPLVFQRTKDLNILVVYGVLGYAPKQPKPDANWDADIARSMRRLAAMLPVRDGATNTLSNTSCSGLRYVIGRPCTAQFHPAHSPAGFDGDADTRQYYSCVYEQARQLNSQRPSNDKIDVTIEFRPGLYPPTFNPPDPFDSSPGGNSGRPPAPYSNLRRAACVSGSWWGTEMTAPCFAQEIGHNFGMEPPGSPHFQDPADPGHSKDAVIADPFAFDFVLRRPYATNAGDTMNNWSTGSWRGADAVLFNAYDWEHMRKQLAAKSGATGPESLGPSSTCQLGP